MARQLDQRDIDLVLERVAGGVAILEALRQAGATWADWTATCKAKPALMDDWDLARRMATHLIPDAVMDIAANVADVKRAKLLVDTQKWIAGSHNRLLYGNTVKVEQTIDISVKAALASGRDRVKTITPLSTPEPIPPEIVIPALELNSSRINAVTPDDISDALPPSPIPSLFD